MANWLGDKIVEDADNSPTLPVHVDKFFFLIQTQFINIHVQLINVIFRNKIGKLFSQFHPLLGNCLFKFLPGLSIYIYICVCVCVQITKYKFITNPGIVRLLLGKKTRKKEN